MADSLPLGLKSSSRPDVSRRSARREGTAWQRVDQVDCSFAWASCLRCRRWPPRRPTEASAPPAPTSPTSASATPGASGVSVGRSDLLDGDAGDIAYPYYLINGRIPVAPTTFNAKPGQRIRIRFINTGSDTTFRVALAGHSMTVTHTDGYPVVPTQVDALLIGMAERYDVIVTAADGVFPLVALAEGKNDLARALLSTGSGASPDPGFRPAELTKRVGTIEMFTATPQLRGT